MKHWRAVLRMGSPLATPLTAARLFGHVCWGLALRDGPEAVADLLTRMAGENPPLVLGEPGPVGFAAMPVVLRDGTIAVEVPGRRRGLWDLYRRLGIMPRAALLRAAGNFSAAGVREALDGSGWLRPMVARREARVRSAASRVSGGPAGRSEWLAVETWPEVDGGQVEVLIASDLEATDIERLLAVGLSNGVGRAASVGYGQVGLAAVEPISEWPEVADANALVTLGPCVPKRGDPAGGSWRVETHWGRVGGAFAGEGVAVEKRPVMGLAAGAVLTTAGVRGQGSGVSEQQETAGIVGRAFVGRLVSGVHSVRSEVVHYGMAPVVAVKVTQ